MTDQTRAYLARARSGGTLAALSGNRMLYMQLMRDLDEIANSAALGWPIRLAAGCVAAAVNSEWVDAGRVG